MWFSLQQWQVSQHTINLWLKSQLHRPTRISVTINLFYNSILRAIYMTKENADISRFSKILQPGVKVYKCQKKYHYQKLTFIHTIIILKKSNIVLKIESLESLSPTEQWSPKIQYGVLDQTFVINAKLIQTLFFIIETFNNYHMELRVLNTVKFFQ